MYYPRIKELRLERGFTQRQVAEALEISLAAYRACEQGQTVLRAPRFVKLAMLYDVPTDYLANLTDQRKRRQ